MSDGVAQLLLSQKAITFYEVLIILILAALLIRQMKKKRQLEERRQITNIKTRNAELEKILKNPDNTVQQVKPPNPFDVQYRHNANNPIPRFQIGIEVHTEISVERYLFDLKQELTIGRDKKNKLPLGNDKLIAKKSCSIFLKDQNVYVRDSGSRNSVYLQRGKKNYRIQNQTVKLQNKDILILGKTSLHISLFEN